MSLTLLLVIIGLALIFDYINGFHDAANAIATIVATKVLTPFQAVVWAAFFNFLAYWVFGFGVADTVAKTADTIKRRTSFGTERCVREEIVGRKDKTFPSNRPTPHFLAH